MSVSHFQISDPKGDHRTDEVEADQPPKVGGTAMTEADSAKLHNQVVETLGGKYKISTPGVSRGNFAWMDVSRPSLPDRKTGHRD